MRNNTCVMRIMEMMKAIEQFCTREEPERGEGAIGKFVLSKHFESIAASIILLNCAFMVWSADRQVEKPGGWETTYTNVLEIFFLVFYTIEAALKLWVHREFYFINMEHARWNILDFSLVTYGYFELLTGGLNLVWLRSLRLFKMAKVLRVLKLVRSLKELRLILECLTGSLVNLFWSIIMLGIIVFMFSLVFVLETGGHFGENPEDLDTLLSSDLYKQFGSVQRSMLSLYAAATGGQDWQMFYFTLEPTGELACFIFILFIAFIQIALVNILTGIFVEKALKSAVPDVEVQAREHKRAIEKERKELRELCAALDQSGDANGAISPKEFESSDADKLKDHLKFMGLEMQDIQALFDLLSGRQKGEVNTETFISACMRMRTGSSVDIQRILCETSVLASHLKRIENSMSRHGYISAAATHHYQKQQMRSEEVSTEEI